MNSYLRRARSAVHEFLRGRPGDGISRTALAANDVPIPVGDNLATSDGQISFIDASRAAGDPTAWLAAFEAALARHVSISEAAIGVIAVHTHLPLDTILPGGERQRFLQLLRPRPGLSDRLGELEQAGLLAALLPELKAARHARLAIQALEGLLADTALSGERFGSMLRELRRPELVVLALLLHDAGGAAAGEVAPDLLTPLRPDDEEARRTVEFLLRNQLQMSQIALRHDTGDSSVIASFASQFSSEEQLKMLCLMTVADLGALGPKTLTPWKAELLWRLFVDTYNHMTMTYGDEVIDNHETALVMVRANRPHDISDTEMAGFFEGLPRRYLTLFEPESLYHHVRLARDIGPDDVHFFLRRQSGVWELTVVTLDKPYLFSNVCGVLSYLDLDILRGHALTSRKGLVVDVFQFTDHKGCLVRPQLDPLLSQVVAGRVNVATLLKDKEPPGRDAGSTHTEPIIYFDTDSSPRYTILEIVSTDRPGLLHRISRVISSHECVVDLVLISTEGLRAVDVFHLRKAGAKLSETDQLVLTHDLEQLLELPAPKAE